MQVRFLEADDVRTRFEAACTRLSTIQRTGQRTVGVIELTRCRGRSVERIYG